jgi:HTH-type transcriptional regulator/antitoxin HigA
MTVHVHQIDSQYLALLRRFPLRPIRNDEQLDAAVEMLNMLLDKRELTEWEQDYLTVLGTLIKKYEDAHYPMPSVSGRDVLEFLMDQYDLRQVDLVPIFGSKSIVSEVLSGKRQLTVKHIRELSKLFHVSADVFIGDDADETDDSEQAVTGQ